MRKRRHVPRQEQGFDRESPTCHCAMTVHSHAAGNQPHRRFRAAWLPARTTQFGATKPAMRRGNGGMLQLERTTSDAVGSRHRPGVSQPCNPTSASHRLTEPTRQTSKSGRLALLLSTCRTCTVLASTARAWLATEMAHGLPHATPSNLPHAH